MNTASPFRRPLLPVALTCLAIATLFGPGCRTVRQDQRVAELITTTPVPSRDPGDQVTPPYGDPVFEPREEPLAVVPPPNAVELTRQLYADGLLVEVFFDFDRAELSAASRDGLERNARYLKSAPEVRLLIEGHCDERGTNEYNLALGQRRAAVALDYLVRLGIAPERLQTISYGEDRWACGESTDRCWARNRRAYFRVTETG